MPLPTSPWQSFRAKTRRLVQRLLGAASGNTALAELRTEIEGELGASTSADEQRRAVLRRLGLQLDLPAGDLSRIPARGPLLVAAELPTGAMEAILLLTLLRSIRGDEIGRAHV